ncbi:MAG TPA: histidine kinase dimerization/phospho-acceptor domain-containing protein, partial [Burkholderiaceae bacterium]|nr:histidine kinase dimerization/phospho-acceptor domain-containing protein [Burkholderiaceae bacterium]
MSSLARSAVILYDCDLRVTQLNSVARRLARARDWIGRPLHQCLSALGGTADPTLDHQALLEHASRGSAFPVRVGDAIWRAELGPLSDGDIAPDSDTSAESGPVTSETGASPGSPVGALVLREAGEAEDYRDLALDRIDFLAALSHDLRTPLNAMLGWLHLLSMPQRGPELAARAIAGLRQAIEQQQRLLVEWADRARAGHAEAQHFTGDASSGSDGSSPASLHLFADADGASAAQAGWDRRARKTSRRHRLVQ